MDSRESRHSLICSLRSRGLSLLVRTDDGGGVPQLSPPTDLWTAFWPTTGNVVWPPRSHVTDEGVQGVVAGFSAWMLVPELPHSVRPTAHDLAQ